MKEKTVTKPHHWISGEKKKREREDYKGFQREKADFTQKIRYQHGFRFLSINVTVDFGRLCLQNFEREKFPTLDTHPNYQSTRDVEQRYIQIYKISSIVSQEATQNLLQRVEEIN